MIDAEGNPNKTAPLGLVQATVGRELGIHGSNETLTLEQAVEKYKANPTPESATQFNQAFWTEACRWERRGRNIVVPEFPETAELKKGEIQLFDLHEVSLVDLGKMFPNMFCWVTTHGGSDEIVDKNDNSGYFSAEMTVDVPYTRTTEEQLTGILKKEGLQPMSLRHYIIFGQMMHLLTGKYPDQDFTFSRLGSYREGRALGADFDSGGYLRVFREIHPGYRDAGLGGRGEKVIKA